MRGKSYWLYLMLVAVLLGLGGCRAEAAPAGTSGGLPVEALVYQGAEVQTQVDVNGAAAVQLVGKALDTVAAQVQKQAAAMQAQPKGPQMAALQGKAQMLTAVLPVIGPAKEMIKSLDRMTVVVMKPQAEVDPGQFMKFYSDLMGDAGWTPLMSVRDKSGLAVVGMIAPEAKGVFLAVNDKKQLVAAVVTTVRPIGDLLGELVQAGGDAFPMVMEHMARKPAAPPAPPQKTQPKAPAKKK